MPTIKEQIASAKAYIKAKQYDDARRILKRVDHPTAKEWLKNLNEKHPPKKQWGTMVLFAILVGVIMFSVGVLILIRFIGQTYPL